MDGAASDPQQVAALLELARDAGLKETASWIVGRHPEWAGDPGRLLPRAADQGRASRPPSRPSSNAQLARFAAAAADPGTAGRATLRRHGAPSVRLGSLRAMAQSGLEDVPGVMDRPGVATSLVGDDRELTRQAVATARVAAPAESKTKAGIAHTRACSRSPSRAETPADAPARRPWRPSRAASQVEPALFAFLLAQLDPEQPVAARSAAADVLSRARLDPDQLVALADALKTAGPLEVDRLLTAFEQSTDERSG